jgi:hypothetical protein
MGGCDKPSYSLTPLWARYRCPCGREYLLTHGDGMTTPPRPYWKQLRRLHLRPYRKDCP